MIGVPFRDGTHSLPITETPRFLSSGERLKLLHWRGEEGPHRSSNQVSHTRLILDGYKTKTPPAPLNNNEATKTETKED